MLDVLGTVRLAEFIFQGLDVVYSCQHNAMEGSVYAPLRYLTKRLKFIKVLDKTPPAGYIGPGNQKTPT